MANASSSALPPTLSASWPAAPLSPCFSADSTNIQHSEWMAFFSFHCANTTMNESAVPQHQRTSRASNIALHTTALQIKLHILLVTFDVEPILTVCDSKVSRKVTMIQMGPFQQGQRRIARVHMIGRHPRLDAFKVIACKGLVRV
jgi:hypothetical protein